MSEKMENVEKKGPATKPVPKRQRDSGSTGAFLAMLIALGAAGGSYYIWQQHLIAEQDRMVLEKSIERLLQVVEQNNQAQQERIEQLRQHQHDETGQRLFALEQSLPELRHQLTLQQQEWSLAEVDYLLRTAEHRLQLNRDIPTAIAALTQARDQLINNTNGEFDGIITAIEQKISELGRLQQDSAEQLALRLGSLITTVESLPLSSTTAQGEALTRTAPVRPAEDAALAEKVKYWGKVVWHDIRSLVTIRHHEDGPAQVLGPQHHTLLQGELRLKLESARVAAINHYQPLYSATLAEAATLLERHFDGDDEAVRGAAATLDELAALKVDTTLPSLTGLRQQLHAVRPLQSISPATVEPLPPTEPAQLYPEEGEPVLPEQIPAIPMPMPWGMQP